MPAQDNMAAKKPATPNRAFKVADQIQRDLTELIARELKDPRVGMVTLQGWRSRPTMPMPRCFSACWWATLRKRRRRSTRRRAFLRNGLFKRLHIHTVPTLHFRVRPHAERAADMNALIAKAVSSRSKDDD
jgi:ribosome-binding factor A